MINECYANPNPLFQPAMRLIAAITNSDPVVVTTTFDHNYVTGTIVRLDITPACGMQQANQMYGPITVTGPTTFTMPINTIFFDPFAIPASADPHINRCSQVVPIGEINQILTAATQNILP